MIHKPVLLKEVLEYLDPKPNENFIDCTVGEGGHADAILEKTGPAGKFLGIDLDSHQIENCKLQLARFGDRVILANDSYTNLKKIVVSLREIPRREKRKNFPCLPAGRSQINGILLDLGMSSAQLEGADKGFSFKVDQGLDMRYNDETGYFTAEKIINEYSYEKLEEILREYGEEKFSNKIAKNIVEQRKQGRIKTTFQLMKIIKDATSAAYWRSKIHYATRTFQALRIAVNDELNNLEKVLPQAISVLSSGGRIIIISFHSLEDRIVKNFLREMEKPASAKATAGVVKILTKKPVVASQDEIKINPRSRSAKLRAAIKI